MVNIAKQPELLLGKEAIAALGVLLQAIDTEDDLGIAVAGHPPHSPELPVPFVEEVLKAGDIDLQELAQVSGPRGLYLLFSNNIEADR